MGVLTTTSRVPCSRVGVCVCVIMSDDEDFMMDSGGEEDFDFDYDEDGSGGDEDVDLENEYYNSKMLKEDDMDGALDGFAKVLELEEEKGEWGFKALKQTLKAYFKLKRYNEMMDKYKILLTYIKSAVTRNYSEKSINGILDYMCTLEDSNLLEQFYTVTLTALAEERNDRLWFKTNLKLARLHFERRSFPRLAGIIKQLYQTCMTSNGDIDVKKGTQVLDVYALEIQMCTEQKNFKRLKVLYHKSLSIEGAIPHPLIMGIIRESGGKMHMRESQWVKAHTDFFEAFKNYDEAGSRRRIQCLKYLVLANMLMQSTINPFDSQEAKPFADHPELVAMTNLVQAYQRNEIRRFERLLKVNREAIMDDPFIREYIDDLLKSIRTQVIVKMLIPYTVVKIPFMSFELNITDNEVETLLVSLILDGKLKGHIDQTEKLFVKAQTTASDKHFQSVDKWISAVDKLSNRVMERVL